jgi:hypothetical protein
MTFLHKHTLVALTAVVAGLLSVPAHAQFQKPEDAVALL